ncbi:transketolase [Intestinibacillus sp. NTUH-41-i26]|uniref:transketolase n=1 Tax=Butyricicoccaceae TaxID=3085642 RepID=UPI000D1D93A0|nr:MULTISPECIES: transketolase [Butyricicoccaceae]WOC76586.1 transketolase [Intestinibacillus sp. NTUH-41-i26]
MDDLTALQKRSFELRKDIVELIRTGKAGHIGGDMSVLEILMTLYLRRMRITPQTAASPDRDRFILSKGHSVEAYLTVLAAAGFLDIAEATEKFSQFGSPYIGHPNNKLPAIEMNTGSLGHGLPVAVGMALAAKMDGKDYRAYVVMGDGELAEGSVWEGAMSAAHYRLDNLCAVVDRNRLQISGSTEDVMALDDLHARFRSFGWHVIDVADGNSVAQLDAAFAQAEWHKGQPSVLIANTVKGCGSAIMENKAGWHHKVPNDEEYQQILQDLAARKEAVQ